PPYATPFPYTTLFRSNRARTVEHRAFDTRHRVARGDGREREEVSGIDVILEHAEMARRHGKAIVEAALAPAGDVDERAIEDRSPILVHMQAAQQHGLNQPAGLGD